MSITITLVFQMLAFLIFSAFTYKFIWPPIINALDDRKKAIAAGLAAAEQGQKAQERAEADVAQMITDAKMRAADIVSQSEQRGNKIVEAAKVAAIAEGERLKVAAQTEIEAEKNRVKQALREQVAAIAVAGAAKILEREVDASSHKILLDKLVAEL